MSAVAASAVPAAAPKADRLMITLAVMSATMMQVLDTTIVNVALPHMQGELGATSDQISWVLTSYLVSSAIFMPLTGYFVDVMGRRRFLLLCIAGFVLSSALCGISQSMSEIVVFRLLQGICGASLVPLSQAILSDAFPPEERGKAMAIWAAGVTVGPILGPTLGGWLTEIASWRWTFYINLPVGAVSLFLSSQFVRETPKSPRRMDWTGFGLLGLGVAALQYLLDRGNHQDWFAATDIRIAGVLSVIGVVAFLYYSITKGRAAVFDVHILRDRNFGMSCLITVLTGVGMFGGMVLQPILLESLLGYPIVTTGMIMAPRGIASAITMMFVGRLVAVIETRVLVLAGVALSAGGSYMMTFYSTDINTQWLVWPGVLQGMGTGLIVVPLSTIAYATLDRTRMAEAAGIFSLVRTIGAAIGISIITTVTTHQTQVIWNELGGHITAYSAPLASYLNRLHLSATDPRGLAIVARQVGLQAQMGAMLDAFKMIASSYVFMLPLLFFLKKPAGRPSAPVPAAALD